ncbi:hypothetical protein PS854_05532 [Pseudomonas fluorescens]|jgi:hypothetical protein|uniref:Uncharacterized protein n=1 Tax=Pseudomonas fluorescens TaxID=294 RepID=A0A5E7PXH8_PSEFL|nr:hypothetical protein PS854_05532 [Pseudomonas fluorescens]
MLIELCPELPHEAALLDKQSVMRAWRNGVGLGNCCDRPIKAEQDSGRY